MLKACIFDLDGTLLDTLPTVLHYCNKSLAGFGLSPITMEQCEKLCRLSIHDFYSQLLRFSDCPADDIERIAAEIPERDLALYTGNPTYKTVPYHGIPELLSALQSRGVVLGVLTNKPDPSAQMLVSHFFSGCFEIVRGQTRSTISKPDRRALLDLLSALGVHTSQCLYVGDTDIDMQTAKSAGVAAAAVTWGYQSEETLQAYSPEYTIRHPSELLKLFSK